MEPLLEVNPPACVFVVGPQIAACYVESSSIGYRHTVRAGIAAALEAEQPFASEEEGRRLARGLAATYERDPTLAASDVVKILARRGSYENWLQRTFGDLRIAHPSAGKGEIGTSTSRAPYPAGASGKRSSCSSLEHLLHLQKCGALLVYTHYDTVLDTAAGTAPVVIREGERYRRWANGETPGFLHINGVYSQPDTVLLDGATGEGLQGSLASLQSLKEIFKKRLAIFVGFRHDPLLPKILQRIYSEEGSVRNPPLLLATSPRTGESGADGFLQLTIAEEELKQLNSLIAAGSEKNFAIGKGLDKQNDGVKVQAFLLFDEKQSFRKLGDVIYQQSKSGEIYVRRDALTVIFKERILYGNLITYGGNGLRQLWELVFSENSPLHSKGLVALGLQNAAIMWTNRKPPGLGNVTGINSVHAYATGRSPHHGQMARASPASSVAGNVSTPSPKTTANLVSPPPIFSSFPVQICSPSSPNSGVVPAAVVGQIPYQIGSPVLIGSTRPTPGMNLAGIIAAMQTSQQAQSTFPVKGNEHTQSYQLFLQHSQQGGAGGGRRGERGGDAERDRRQVQKGLKPANLELTSLTQLPSSMIISTAPADLQSASSCSSAHTTEASTPVMVLGNARPHIGTGAYCIALPSQILSSIPGHVNCDKTFEHTIQYIEQSTNPKVELQSQKHQEQSQKHQEQRVSPVKSKVSPHEQSYDSSRDSPRRPKGRLNIDVTKLTPIPKNARSRLSDDSLGEIVSQATTAGGNHETNVSMVRNPALSPKRPSSNPSPPLSSHSYTSYIAQPAMPTNPHSNSAFCKVPRNQKHSPILMTVESVQSPTSHHSGSVTTRTGHTQSHTQATGNQRTPQQNPTPNLQPLALLPSLPPSTSAHATAVLPGGTGMVVTPTTLLPSTPFLSPLAANPLGFYILAPGTTPSVSGNVTQQPLLVANPALNPTTALLQNYPLALGQTPGVDLSATTAQQLQQLQVMQLAQSLQQQQQLVANQLQMQQAAKVTDHSISSTPQQQQSSSLPSSNNKHTSHTQQSYHSQDKQPAKRPHPDSDDDVAKASTPQRKRKCSVSLPNIQKDIQTSHSSGSSPSKGNDCVQMKVHVDVPFNHALQGPDNEPRERKNSTGSEADTGTETDTESTPTHSSSASTSGVPVTASDQPPNRNPGLYKGHIQLWEFLLDLLLTPDHGSIIQWTGNGYEFQIVNPDAVARLWGARKNKPHMTYEKMSRALRYYYTRGIMERVTGKRLTFRFAFDIQKYVVNHKTCVQGMSVV